MSCSICGNTSHFVCSKNCGATFCSKECSQQALPCTFAKISGREEQSNELLKMAPYKLYLTFNNGTTMPEEVKMPSFQRKYVPMHSSEEWDFAFYQSFYHDFTFVNTFLSAVLKMKAWKPSARTDYFLLNYAAQNDKLEIFKLLLSSQNVWKTTPEKLIEAAALADSTNVLDFMISDLKYDPSTSNNRALMYAAKYDLYKSVERLLQDERVRRESVKRAVGAAIENGSAKSLELLLPFATDVSRAQFERVFRDPDIDDRTKEIIRRYLEEESTTKRLKMGLKI